MTTQAFHALAPTFRYVSATDDASLDYDVRIVTGTDTYDIEFPTGLYRACLAPTTGDVVDLIRALNAAIFALTDPDGVVLAFTIGADGVVSVQNPTGAFTELHIAPALARILGFPEANTDLLFPLFGAYPCWHLALLTAVTGARPEPVFLGGADKNGAGRVFTFAAAPPSYVRTLAVSMQPTDPAQRVACEAEASAFYPAPEYMHRVGAVDTAREWSVLDVLWSARNAECAFAMGTWQTIRGSTSEAYWLTYVDAETLLKVRTTPLREEWAYWEKWPLMLSHPSDGVTGTRA